MKVHDMSAESGTASPNVKKMKQARLPFQVIGSESPKAESPVTKKRKLSVQNDDIPVKVGKLSEQKENNLSTKSEVESVVVSDDEVEIISPEETISDSANETSAPNPLVNYVGAALQRKLRKRTTTAETLPKKKSKVSLKNISTPVSKSKSKKGAKKTITTSEYTTSLKNILPSDSEDVINLNDEDVVMLDESEEPSQVVINESVPTSSDDNESKAKDIPFESGSSKDSDCPKTELCNPDKQSETSKSPKRNASQNKEEFTTPKSSRRVTESKSDIVDDNDPSETTIESSPNVSIDLQKLTPKQLQKRMDSTKKQQEREREKQEREKKRQDEKDERNRQRLEKEEQKKKEREEKEDQKKKEREEKEEQRKKEREEKERLKEEEKKLKEKQEEEKRIEKKREKEAKEEERRKKESEKEEEKRKKDLEKEEAENKKKKASAAFVNFFVAKESKNASENCPSEKAVKNEYLSNFTIKSDMRLAPIVRCPLNDERKNSLDSHLLEQKIEMEDLYVTQLRLKECIGKRSSHTWPITDLKNEVFIVEDNLPPIEESKEGNLVILEANPTGEILRPKLLSFSENRRPPYWGTWRRKSSFVNGRKPFALDKKHLDYSCDSDEEWEEEEPGESVGGSVAGGDDDDEEDNENEYDVDNDFMVPHGYLSEEEALGEEDQNDFSPETQKAKLKVLEYEFQNEMKKTTEKLHPRLIGMYWQNNDCSKPPVCAEAVWNYLSIRKMLTSESQVCITSAIDSNDFEADETLKNSERSAVKKQKISDTMVPELIRLVHGNTNSRGFLANEFQLHIANMKKTEDKEANAESKPTSPSPPGISKISIARKIKEVSKWMCCPDEGVMQSKMCWYVSSDVREKYNMADLELPNSWSYTLTPKRKFDPARQKVPKVKAAQEAPDAGEESLNLKKECAFNIKKFTKQMTHEERKKQFVSPSPAVVAGSKNQENAVVGNSRVNQTVESPVNPPEKKRVSLLFSGPRGKSLPQNASTDKVSDTAALSVPNSSNVEIPPIKTQEKKRVQILASAPIGQDIPKTFKTNLLTQFIKTVAKEELKNKTNATASDSHTEIDDCCIVLSD